MLHDEAADLVPPDWQLQPRDPNWHGRRYISPDGSAWLALYAAPANQQALSEHMKAFAFVEGEEIISLRGERDTISVLALKGDRLSYRKAVLACGGTRWHHVAFEYPGTEKRGMERHVALVMHTLNKRGDEDCETAVSSQ